MTKRDGGEIAVAGPDAHGASDVLPISDEMTRVAFDSLGLRAGARGDLDARGLRFFRRAGMEQVKFVVEENRASAQSPRRVEAALGWQAVVERHSRESSPLQREEKREPLRAVGQPEGNALAGGELRQRLRPGD